jgi:maltooligosyltrehalose trehalohydrolase
MTALTLLGPWTPMLFQGQEFSAPSPFLFFADHDPALATLIRRGRAEFLRQFPRLAQPRIQHQLADPASASTFEQCKLKQEDRDAHPQAWALHADLLRLRREDATIAAQGAHGIDGAVLSPEAFLLRFFGAPGTAADRLLLVNLGPDLTLPIVPEPLLAPPAEHAWEVRWSTESPAYGGLDVPRVETNPGWELPSGSAVLLAAVSTSEPRSSETKSVSETT